MVKLLASKELTVRGAIIFIFQRIVGNLIQRTPIVLFQNSFTVFPGKNSGSILNNNCMELYEIYCAGKFQKTTTPLNVTNPFSGEVFAQTFYAGKEELEIAIHAAQNVQREMKELPSRKKY